MKKNFRRMEMIARTAAYLDAADLQWCIERMRSDYRKRVLGAEKKGERE